ncbi:hypothetical protein ACFFHH_15070 [Cytobacillus solani]|uniref:hypothetical protein n=1 Tax=Cytobacillus solani TaxID=1637975 RepID=UPI0006ABAC07|nr:hypothetical protein [Cytobacillus solani]KOP81358.1 hypothetical protein AMS60_01940 [Bacillus sp. FJAT-21945]
MKTKVKITLQKDIIDTFTKLVPNKKRSQIIRNHLINTEELNVNTEEFNNIIINIENEEKKSIDVFLNEHSLRKLDSFVSQTEEMIAKEKAEPVIITRSMIFHLILTEINEKYKDSPIPATKSKIKPFYVPVSDKKDLLKYINKREITSSLENFINEVYTGPTNDEIFNLKTKPKEKMELLQLSLDDTTIEELDQNAKDFNANRSQVFRNVVKQFINTLKFRNEDVREQINYKLDILVDEFKEVTTEEIILETIQNYQIKR